MRVVAVEVRSDGDDDDVLDEEEDVDDENSERTDAIMTRSEEATQTFDFVCEVTVNALSIETEHTHSNTLRR
jgi:hypothetical protein